MVFLRATVTVNEQAARTAGVSANSNIPGLKTPSAAAALEVATMATSDTAIA